MSTSRFSQSFNNQAGGTIGGTKNDKRQRIPVFRISAHYSDGGCGVRSFLPKRRSSVPELQGAGVQMRSLLAKLILSFFITLSCCNSENLGTYEDPFPKGVARTIVFVVFALVIFLVGVIAIYQTIKERNEDNKEDDPPFG